jgi:predicted transcriptional regulator
MATTTTLRLPSELESDLKRLAKEHERSDHGEMIYALKEYVKRCKRANEAAKEIDEQIKGDGAIII